MGEQELEAFMGAEFMTGTVMDDWRVQPVQRARGPTAAGKAHPLARRTSEHIFAEVGDVSTLFFTWGTHYGPVRYSVM